MLAAIIGSTIPSGRRKRSSVDTASEIEWASVKALITLTRSHKFATASTSAPTKSRWSYPVRMCMTPWRTNRIAAWVRSPRESVDAPAVNVETQEQSKSNGSR